MYADMMPTIEARENLNGATVAALGSGSMKKAAADRVQAQWRRRARGTLGTQAKPTREQRRTVLAQLGFRVVKES